MLEYEPKVETQPYAWVVVGLLFVVAMLNYLDRLILASMRDPIQADITMSYGQFGLLTSAFLWVYAAMSPLGGWLADRMGRKRVIVASLFFWSAATFLTGLSHTFRQMLTARAMMGVSEACYIPAGLALISDYHRGSTRSLATGIHMIGIYAGTALGGIGAVLSEHVGWRYGFRLFGGFGIAYSLILLAFLRDAEPVEVEGGSQDLSPSLITALAAVFSSPAFVALFAVNVLVGVVNWTVYGWMPTFLKERFGLGLGEAGMSATAYIASASFFGVLAAGIFADRWSRTSSRARALTPAIGFLLAGPCLFAAAGSHVFAFTIAGLIVFGLGRGSIDANQMPLVRQILPPHLSATAYGLLNLISTTAGGVMVYVGGALLDAHIDLSHIFQFAGVGLVLGGLILVAMRPRPSVYAV
jgi:predicted MFS family arabinose efflux permease